MDRDVIPVLVLVLIAVTVLTVVFIVVYERSRRAAQRVELQKTILERVGSVKDFAEFLTTEQGERFLASLAPGEFRPQQRVLASVRFGVLLLTVGVFLMTALHTLPLGRPGATNPPAILFAMLLLIAAGVGLLLSAAVSVVIARRLGLFNGRSPSSRKDDAV